MFFEAKDIARFRSKIVKANDAGCMIWSAHRNNKGYGIFRLDGKNRLAHRVSYAMSVGPVPGDLVLDHQCGNPACVNPEHLEPVTQAVNIQRGLLRRGITPAPDATEQRCPQGHAISGSNIYALRHGGKRCRKCREDRVLRPTR